MSDKMSHGYLNGSRTDIWKFLLLINKIKPNDKWEETLLINGSQPTDI